MIFNLFIKEDFILIVGMKKGREEELQNPTMDFNQALKKATINSRVSQSMEDWIQADISTGASSSRVPPLPLQGEI